jgi:translocator assembly and maintenance protein 41
VDNLCSDLLNWRTLYLAGRMHKPLRIIKDDARVRLTQQVNLTSAVRVALLTLPESFSETELFETITRISYAGDPRMMLPAENRGKVGNIVRKQGPQFKELYHRLVTGLPGVHWPMSLHTIQQDVSPHARAALLRKLPSNLLTKVKNNSDIRSATSSAPEDDSAYWIQLASHDKLGDVLTQGKEPLLMVTNHLRSTRITEMNDIVRYPATVQSVKGVVSAGLGKSVRYSAAKVRKWWEGGPSKNTSSSS